MAENRASVPGAGGPSVPGIDVKINLPRDPEKDYGKLLGYLITSHPGVLSIFVTQARKEMDAMQKQAEKKPSIKAQLAAKPAAGDQPSKPKDREAR